MPVPIVVDSELSAPRGAFVTMTVSGRLRGCIGCIDSHRPLVDVVMECAVAAATSDLRFQALTVEEIPHARFQISVLSVAAPAPDPCGIEPGTHGVIVRSGDLRGVLLPQVATEHGFSREEFLDAACLKTGLPAGTWRTGTVVLEVFTAEVFEDPAAS